MFFLRTVFQTRVGSKLTFILKNNYFIKFPKIQLLLLNKKIFYNQIYYVLVKYIIKNN